MQLNLHCEKGELEHFLMVQFHNVTKRGAREHAVEIGGCHGIGPFGCLS